MEKRYFNYYLHTLNQFTKKYELKNYGVFEIVLQENQDIFSKLTHLEEVYHFSESEVVTLITAYNRLNKVYTSRFEEIFTRCVGYQSIKSNVNFYLGGVTPWTRKILSLSEDDLAKLRIKTEGMNETQACRVYSEVIKLDDKTLEQLVDDCYRSF